MNEENTQNVQEIESAQTTDILSDETLVPETETNTEEIQSVSQGDALVLEDNNTYTETEAVTYIPYDDTILLQKIDTLANANICIIWLIIAIWVEKRLRNAVGRYFGHGKFD